MACGFLLRQALMRRLNNWPSRFAALVESARAQPFEWGAHDCCLWAASAVLAITGVDPAHAWRAGYRTERAAMRILASLGGLEGAGALTGIPVALACAAIGDIGLVNWPDGARSLAVCAGHTWMCAGEAGLVHLPLDAASVAWGVGRE